MGRIYLEHMGGRRTFTCSQCHTFLTNRNELISRRFTGANGRGFLFNKVVNLRYSQIPTAAPTAKLCETFGARTAT